MSSRLSKSNKRVYTKSKPRGKDKVIYASSHHKVVTTAGDATSDVRWNELVEGVSSNYLFTVTGLRWMINITVHGYDFPDIIDDGIGVICTEVTWVLVKLDQGETPAQYTGSATDPMPNNNQLFKPWPQVISWGKALIAGDGGQILPAVRFDDTTKAMRKIKMGESMAIFWRARNVGRKIDNTSSGTVVADTTLQSFHLMT